MGYHLAAILLKHLCVILIKLAKNSATGHSRSINDTDEKSEGITLKSKNLDVMDNIELSADENEFLRLRKEGKTTGEIANVLGLPLHLILQWTLTYMLAEKDAYQKGMEELMKLKDEIMRAGTTIPNAKHEHQYDNIIDSINQKFNEKVERDTLRNWQNRKGYHYKLLTNASKDFFHDSSNKTALPFALKKIEIKNYQGIIHTCLENIPVDAHWILLTGVNGYGKTTLLQAIAIGLLGDKDGDNILSDDPAT
ncbi:MAG TPA: AAA family ATPase, partial [Cytophagales bacterium]